MPYATNKCADQPAHPHSLICAFVVHCLDSIIPPVSKSKISSLYLASVAEQAGLSLTWSQTPKTGFLATGLNYFMTNLRESYVAEQGFELPIPGLKSDFKSDVQFTMLPGLTNALIVALGL